MTKPHNQSINPMPVTSAHCGLRPNQKAMESDFTVDFSRAKDFLASSNADGEPASNTNQNESDVPLVRPKG